MRPMPAMPNKGPQRSAMPAGSTSPGGPPGASTTKSPPSQPRVQPINNSSGASSSLATAYNSKRPHFQLRTNPTRPTGYQRPGRERTMSVSDRRALLKLDFLIIGGGIAGLACAFELSRYGHHVRVLEKTSGRCQRGGGIRVPPNLTIILLEWGMKNELVKLATRVRASTFYSLETGEPIGSLEWKEDVIQETGADFLLMAYDDLHRMLHRLAISAGAKVIYDASVTTVSVDEDTETAHAFLANGEVMKADIIIGADGYRSIVRDVITDQDNDGLPSGMSILSATIPVEAMKSDPELYELATTPEWPMWMGDSCSVLGYPIYQGKEYAVHVFWPDNKCRPGEVEEGWDVVESTDSCVFAPCEPRINRLLSLIPDVLRTKYVERNPVEEWVDPSGRLVLIGEAAHPLLPCSMHGPSLAMEDAVVFGVLFSRLRNYEQIPILTEAYQDLRMSRCKLVNEGELNNARLVWMPPGKARDQRDAYMKASRACGNEHWDEGQLRKQWEEIAGVFGYCARDAAEDWWVNWGALRERSQAMNPLEFDYQTVTEVVTTPLEKTGFTEVAA